MALPILLLATLGGCGGGDLCSNKILEAKADQSGALVEYLYVRDCGATTGFSTQVAIGKRGESPGEAEIVFIADDDHGRALMDGKAIWNAVRWTGPNRLSIAYAEKARVFKKVEQAAGVAVTFRATGPYQMPPVMVY